ncbi:MAG: cation transporter [Croceitalea sp.]|nr:cation transporter [Croceitalea sp.]
MKTAYQVSGMTCQGCVASIVENLKQLDRVLEVQVDLEKEEAIIESEVEIPDSTLQAVLSSKYQITRKKAIGQKAQTNVNGQKSKWVQLRPLFLIFAYLFVASYLLNLGDWNTTEAMLDFMGLFYIVFSFFKFLDLKGFPESFSMYDPLAKRAPLYGWVYPFIELALGLMFLMRVQIPLALIATIIVLGITTIGVSKTLLDKKKIRCACLGTALQLPMTEATFIENSIMLIMAISMVIQIF